MFKENILRYWRSGVVEKYICVNVAVYIIAVLIALFSGLFNIPSASVGFVKYLELPASPLLLLYRPWTLFTYMFVHTDLWHILWNMLALYAFGRIFLNFYSVRHFVGTYMLGGIIGGLVFVAAFNFFPAFKGFVDGSFLLGASASVLAIVVASAVRSPNFRVNLFLFGSVRLSTIVIVVVAVSVLMISGSNPGGNFAHLGGAFAGWIVAKLLNKGVDITSLVNGPIDFLSGIFKRKPVSRGRGKFHYSRTASSAGKRADDYDYNARKKAGEAEIDRILEKIKKGGYSSLTDAEKKRLFDASAK